MTLLNNKLIAWCKKPSSGLLTLCMLPFVVLGIGVVSGCHIGADRVLPGAMARHRDAMAIAISYLSHNHWSGYTSLFEVNSRLDEMGMSYHLYPTTEKHPHDLRRELYCNAPMLNEALRSASSMSIIDPDHLYFMDPHEKGLAIFYIICFGLFGIRIQSLFYGFMLIVFLAALAFVLQFRNNRACLWLLLACSVAMCVTVQVVQRLEPDVNAIHSSRYLPLLNVIPLLHLLLLVVRNVSMSKCSVGCAAVQTGIVVLALFSRTSGFWMIIAFGVLCFAYGARQWFSKPVETADISMNTNIRWWPIVLLGASLVLLQMHITYGLHPHYYENEGLATRTSWHHFLIAAHYNPERTQRYGIPDCPPYDDMVAYSLFERELERRGEKLEDYLHPDVATWRLRTTHRWADYQWAKYDSVVRSVFFDLVRDDPAYVARSVLIHEPRAVIDQLGSREFWRWRHVLDYRLLAILFVGAFLARHDLAGLRVWPWVLGGLLVFGLSLLPAMVSGVMPLRLVESFVVLLVGMYLVMGYCLAWCMNMLPSKTTDQAESVKNMSLPRRS